jgi:lysophospholipase L1-like esterase
MSRKTYGVLAIRRRHPHWFLLLTAALAGCGGGDDISATPSSCSPRAVTVALLGDSTMYGIDGFTHQRVDRDPGELLQADMDARFGPGAVSVTNYGVPGQRADQAKPVEADIVVENYGINDMVRTIGQYQSSVRALGATIVETQSPVLREPMAVQERYAQAAEQVAAVSGAGLADAFTYVQSLPDWESQLGSDHVHPGAYLYTLIVRDVLAPAVAEQVAPFRCEVKS